VAGVDLSQVALARAAAGGDGVEHLQRAAVPSDTRTLELILARLRSG
jgi:hypothetical protein